MLHIYDTYEKHISNVQWRQYKVRKNIISNTIDDYTDVFEQLFCYVCAFCIGAT